MIGPDKEVAGTSSETLEAPIAAWPDQGKAARLNYSSALDHLAELQRQLARLNAAAALEPPTEPPQALNNDPAVIDADLNLEHEVRLATLQADHVRAMAEAGLEVTTAHLKMALAELDEGGRRVQRLLGFRPEQAPGRTIDPAPGGATTATSFPQRRTEST